MKLGYDRHICEEIVFARPNIKSYQASQKNKRKADSLCVCDSPKDAKKARDDKHDKEDSDDENRSLRELLMINLDLIQSQQEQLKTKELIIKTLTSEKQALQCKLERMERPINLTKPSTPSGTPKKSALALCSEQQHFASGQRDCKKYSTFELQSRDRTFTLNKQCWSRSSTPPKLKVCDDTQETDDSASVMPIGSREQKLKAIASRYKNTLCTDQLYHIASDSNIQLELNTDDHLLTASAEKCLHAKVEIPSWQIKIIPTGYQMEGTEPLSDDIYLRRHQKHEAEERRRKRWEVQRLREQEAFERHKKKANPEKRMEIKSFWHQKDGIKFIYVEDTIPVSAFGHPIPCIIPSEFELPWFDSRSRPRKKVVRQRKK